MKTKEKFLTVSSQLFGSQGFSGTGLKQIVTDAGAPWGSVYHFFPEGKEQLGAEAVLHAGAQDNEQFLMAFERKKDVAIAVSTIFKAEIKRLKATDFNYGCTVASVASDVATTSERVREACSKAFMQWQQTISNAFIARSVPKKESDAIADFVLSALEGSTLLCRTYRSVKPMKNAMEMVDILVKDTLTKIEVNR